MSGPRPHSRKKGTAKRAVKKAVKKPVKKAVVKKAIKKTIVKKAIKKGIVRKAVKKKIARKPNAAFMKALSPSASLAEVIGNVAVPRTEAVKKIWNYIKKNNLQDKANRRMINADEKLRPLFGKNQISMFDLAKILSKELKEKNN
jgi:upstream activation factor subunit UAF30